MFKCNICEKITKPREKMHKKTILERDKVYTHKDKEGKVITTKGKEIVKEINICENCFRKESE